MRCIIMERCFKNSDKVDMNIEPGSSVMDLKGIRVYTKMKEYATLGKCSK